MGSKEVIEADSDDNTPGIITETVGSYTDESGNKVWICAAYGKQDDGSPMIGCDSCDDWYHWLCVGIKSEPGENQDWFCTRCVAKKQVLPAKIKKEVDEEAIRKEEEKRREEERLRKEEK